MNPRSRRKQQELLDALRFDPSQLWPALRALRSVMTPKELTEWIRRHNVQVSTTYVAEWTRPSPSRGGEHPDGSGPIPPVPGRRAA